MSELSAVRGGVSPWSLVCELGPEQAGRAEARAQADPGLLRLTSSLFPGVLFISSVRSSSPSPGFHIAILISLWFAPLPGSTTLPLLSPTFSPPPPPPSSSPRPLTPPWRTSPSRSSRPASQQECFPSPPAMCTLPRSEREPTRQGSRGSGGSARRQSRTSRASSSVYLCPLSVGAAVADLVPSSVASFRSTHPDRLATRSRSLSRTERRSTTTLPTST